MNISLATSPATTKASAQEPCSRQRLERLLADEATPAEIQSILLDLPGHSLQADDFNTLVGLFRERRRSAALSQSAADTFLQNYGRESIDCSGTGGSGLPHFNTSTAVAFTLAAAGQAVAKFGNKAASGRSGSFDLLDALGFPGFIRLDKLPEAVERTNLALLYARQFYPQLARLAEIRRAIGKPTILNYAGPLLNPAEPSFRLMGVSNQAVIPAIANYLLKSGDRFKAGMIVRSADGLDEIAAQGISHYVKLCGQNMTAGQINAANLLGILPLTRPAMTLDARTNARLLLNIAYAQDSSSIYFGQVVLNAAAALVVTGKCLTLAEGCHKVHELLTSGAVGKHIEKCRRHYERISC